ncbi:CPBP family intramembrane glutamic endopeptidase [Nocardioides sambongensis]|uniref:CPBP family intramembrane glutamic endopeptidase n=1 Tax=Nocardioides sambongensis TaxID=2589074 RepID=UPI00112CB6D7|nr:type II CAAX endopeptidase family protein [Nocardioides sambongensis]
MQSEPGRYHQIPGLAAPGVWRPLVGVVLLVVLVFGGQLVLSTVVGVILVLGGLDAETALDRLAGDPVTPVFLAVVNLGWALAIPAVFLVLFLLHRLRPGWAASVAGRMRWRWLAACLGMAVVALTATVLVSTFLPSQGDASVEVSGTANEWNAQMRDFVLVVLLLTPLQAAGEEYAFRGYLTQAMGGLLGPLGDRVAVVGAVVVPAFLFACAHGLGQDVPIFFDRFAFGLVAGILVLLTGGLEAGIAMHVLNNFLAFGLALAFGDMTAALTPTDGTWWSIPVTLTQSLAYLGGCWWMARRMGVADRGRVPVLERSGARV